jgi:hypothetical protein
MFHPAHIDGRTLVILRRHRALLRRVFRIVASGRLEYDGASLSLVNGPSERVITDSEREALMLVSSDTRIPQCRGFDLFLIEQAEV